MKRRKNNRKKDHDYNWYGSYFVTICTKEKEYVFGTVKDDQMHLNAHGSIAQETWHSITKHYDDVELGQFVVMPNHVHGVIHLLPDARYDDISDVNNTSNGRDKIYNSIVDNQNHTEGRDKACLVPTEQNQRNNARLSKIIGSYKSAVTKEINRLASTNSFTWQRSFHDHIIKNNGSRELIEEYIFNNPIYWNKDRYNPLGVSNKS